MSSVFKKNNIALIILLVLFSCVKPLIPTNNSYVAKTVVWAILNPDSTLTLVTSGNRGLEDNDMVNITNIDMFLFENGLLVDQLHNQSIHSDSQTHRFSFKPKHNKTYTIKMVNQEVEINGLVAMPNPFLKPDQVSLTQGDNAQLSYTITDDESFNDAYQFSVEMYHYGVLADTASGDTIDKNYLFKRGYDKYEEPELNYNFLGLNNSGLDIYTFPVADYLFNGKKKRFLFTLQNPITNIFFIPRNIISGAPVSNKLICTKQYVLIKCRKISPDYYKFLVSENKNNAIFGTPYFNPTNVYSNIQGGLGLIGAMVERTDTVWIKK